MQDYFGVVDLCEVGKPVFSDSKQGITSMRMCLAKEQAEGEACLYMSLRGLVLRIA